MKNYIVIGLVAAVILGIIGWWWFVQVPQTEAPTIPAGGEESRSESQQGGTDTTASIESDLDAAAPGDLDGEFRSIDGDLNNL